MTPDEPRPVTDARSGETVSVPTTRYSMDVAILLGILALWFILQIWVLPKAGVPT